MIDFYVSAYGNSYVSFLTVCLQSLLSQHPDDRVTVAWSQIKPHEIEVLQTTYEKVRFLEKDFAVTHGNLHQRISLKLRSWVDYLKSSSAETICFLDCDILVQANIALLLQGDYDILYTWKDERFPVNIGVLATKNNERTASFFECWLAQVEDIVADNMRLADACAKSGAADQHALLSMMNTERHEHDFSRKFPFGEICFHPIPCSILNETNSVAVDGEARILHYKGGWHPVLLEEAQYSQNRPEETSAEMRYHWEHRYEDTALTVLKNFVLAAAQRHVGLVDWSRLGYTDRGVLHSEMLLAVAVAKQLGVEVILESGTCRGQSTVVLAEAFQNSGVEIISVDWQQGKDACAAQERLASYPHVKLVYGDSARLLPQFARNHPDKKIGVLFDGPKGELAFRLFASMIATQDNILVAFFHDCRQPRGRMPGPGRVAIHTYFDRCFFSDDEDFVAQFSHLDAPCQPASGEVNQHSWRPYRKGWARIGSYGPTLAVVLPTGRDAARGLQPPPTGHGAHACGSGGWKNKILSGIRGILPGLNAKAVRPTSGGSPF